MARARFSVLDPVPLRKTERHTRVCCNSSKYWSTVLDEPVFVMSEVAISDPHEGIARQRGNVGRTIDEQISVIVYPDTFPRKRLWRRSFDLLSTLLEFAAVAG